MAAVILSDPEIIGAYSLDEDRQYKNDMSGLKYLKIPNLNKITINLNEGDYKDKAKNYDTLERIKQITSFIMDNPESVVKNGRIDADFVCFRGALKFLMITPYNKNPTWVVKAVKFKGTIYFIIEMDYKMNKGNKKVGDKSYQYGFKFESYVLTDDPKENPRGSTEIVNENEEFCILMSRTIDNSLKIIFGIESDGIKAGDEGNKINTLDELKKSKLVEVKTKIDNGKPIPKHMERDWWCQSYIASIDQIHFGSRDYNGIVTEIKAYDVKALEDDTIKNTCLKFLKKFLNQVKEKMRNVDDPKRVYYFKCDQNQKKIDVHLDKNNVIFLSDNYINFINNLK